MPGWGWDGRGMDDAPYSEHLVGPRGAALVQTLALGCCLHHTRDLLWAGPPGVLVGSVVPCSWSPGLLQELRCGTQPLAAITANTPHTQTGDNNKQPCLHQPIFSSCSKLEIPGGAGTPRE